MPKVSNHPASPPSRLSEGRPPATTVGYPLAVVIITIAALALLPLRSLLSSIDVAMVFLLAVVGVASRGSRGPALLASGLAILAFDVLFVPPYYRLTVDDTAYVLTFGVMLVVAAVMSGLTTQVRAQAVEASRREQEASARFELQKATAAANHPTQVLAALAREVGEIVGSVGRVIMPLPESEDQTAPQWPPDPLLEDTETRLATLWAWTHGDLAGHGTAHGAEADCLVVPARSAQGCLAVILFPATPLMTELDADDHRLITELVAQAVASLDRALLAQRHDAARLEVEAERLRTSLLSSLSHDLRTPLSNIEGAASSILDPDAALSAETRRELAQGILAESQRMHRLVINLLDMVRVESGTLAVHRSWQPLEEVLGVALLRFDDSSTQHPVAVSLPSDLPLVQIDELLIEQVFLNLLENASRHTPPGTPVAVTATRQDGAVVASVADQGPGIPEEERERVFEKFYQSGGTAEPHSIGGAGLGLAICQGIVAAHGGRIWVEANPGGGTVVRFSLPVIDPPPQALPAEEPDS